MTYHFSANLPDRGIGIVSDSVVSHINQAGTWEKTHNCPKTFIISKYAAISCAGHAKLCVSTIQSLTRELRDDAVFSEIAPLIQKAYLSAAAEIGYEKVEFILAAKTLKTKSKTKLIKYEMKKSGIGLVRVEDKEHYSAGLDLHNLDEELCVLLTENYRRTFFIEKTMGDFYHKMSHIIHSPKSFPLGICFGVMMPVIKEYVRTHGYNEAIGDPWTILLLPEDGEIHFQPSTMYDGSKSVMPHDIRTQQF